MFRKSVSEYPVMKVMCATCPFKPNEHGIWQNVELAAQVIERTLFKGQQICHGSEGPRRQWRNRCKGAHDHNMQIYERMGFDLTKLK